MLKPAGRLSEDGIQDLLRTIYKEARGGELEIVQGGQRRKLHFRGGELYLAGTHPLAKRFAERLGRLQELKRDAVRRATLPETGVERDEAVDLSSQLTQAWQEVRVLVGRIAEVVGEWREGDYEWHPDAGSQATGLVGPLPTATLIMLGALPQRDEPWLLAQLGGERRLWTVSSTPGALRDREQLAPEETWLIEQLRQPCELRELLGGGLMARAAVLEKLLQLHAAGMVRPVDEAPTAVVDEDLVDAAVLARFADRIRQELAEQPPAGDPTARRARVAELLARMGGLSYYELLATGPHASAEEVYAAYGAVAKLVHSSQAAALGMVGSEKALQLLFETATRAYLTLCDPDRRRDYNERIGVEVRPIGPDRERRSEEERSLARQNYERALALAARSEFHFAVELLQQAVKSDPKAEYYAALGKTLGRNPNWLRRAVDAYRHAVDLAPKDIGLRLELGRLYEQVADFDRARVQYISALKLNEHNLEVREALERLNPEGGRGKGSFFERLFGR